MKYILLSLLFINFSYLYAVDRFSIYDEITMSNVMVKVSDTQEVELLSNLIVVNDFLYALAKFDIDDALDGKGRVESVFDNYGELYDYQVAFHQDYETGALISKIWSYKELDNITRRNLHSNIGTLTMTESPSDILPFGALEMNYARYEGIVNAQPDMNIQVGVAPSVGEQYSSGVVPYADGICGTDDFADCSIAYYGGYIKAIVDGNINTLYTSEYKENLPVNILYVENDGNNSKGRVIFDQYKIFDFATNNTQLRVQRKAAPNTLTYPSDDGLDWGADGVATTYSKTDLNSTRAIYYIFDYTSGDFHDTAIECSMADQNVSFNQYGILYLNKNNDIYNDIDVLLDFDTVENNHTITCGSTQMKVKKRYLEGNLKELSDDNTSLTFLASDFTLPTEKYDHQKIVDVGVKVDVQEWGDVALNKEFIDCSTVSVNFGGNVKSSEIGDLLNGKFTKCAIVNGVLLASNDDDALIFDNVRKALYEIVDNDRNGNFDDPLVFNQFNTYSSWIPIYTTYTQLYAIEDTYLYMPNVVSINANNIGDSTEDIVNHITKKTLEAWYKFGLLKSYPNIFDLNSTTTFGKIAIEAMDGDSPWYKNSVSGASSAEDILDFFINIMGIYRGLFTPVSAVQMPQTKEDLIIKLEETDNGKKLLKILNDSTYSLLPNGLKYDLNITVSAQNSEPVANAGTDQNVYTSALVTLNASESMDVNHDPITYTWSVTSKPDGSSAGLSDTSIMNPTFSADIDGDYVFKLIVNDGSLDSLEDSVTINSSTLEELAPPSFEQ